MKAGAKAKPLPAAKKPLGSSSNAGAAAPSADGRTVEQIYQKKTQLEHILLRPDTYGASAIPPSPSRGERDWVARHPRSAP
jgi:hypothetical protein